MKQVVQPVGGGTVRLLDVPRPTIGPTEVLVQTVASVISPGTERALTTIAQSGLVAKARARPDLVRQVVNRARTEGIRPTIQKVRDRLGGDLPLGYSVAGIAVEVGEAVSGVTAGQLVATGGAGHAEFQAVSGLLCCAVPDRVPPSDAAFTTIASIALHGLRLADVGPGSKVVVIGLGLVGQLTARLAAAAGCDVAGIDLTEFAVDRATAAGVTAFVDAGEQTTAAIIEWSRGRGADAVLLTAAGSSSDAVRRAPSLCRDRATVVVVGDVGLHLERRPFYERELAVRFARSYGPGRYERTYEDWGVDYPAGMVRWTEGRNFEAVLDLLAGGRFQVADLVTQRFPIAEATAAYELIRSQAEPYLAVALTYPETAAPDRPIVLKPPSTSRSPGLGLIGAGAFATSVLVPALRGAGFDRLVSVASASGLSARRLAERAGFEKAVSGIEAVVTDPAVEVVVIATRHDTHAQFAAEALQAGKHVWCEKPLALSEQELELVRDAQQKGGGVLFVGFNRRYSPAMDLVTAHFLGAAGPKVITYRVNAGRLPEDHWYADRRQGGRLLGEACHFIDACDAIVGMPAEAVTAMGAGAESVLTQDFVIALRYPDGSVATITYATGGPPRLAKERVEILGGGRSAVITDFREVMLDDAKPVACADPKGHRAAAASFLAMVRGTAHPWDPYTTTITTLAAAASLGRQGS